METPAHAILDANCTIAQVLSAYPQAVPVFFQLKTDCVGCVLSHLCTLTDVAKAYDLDIEHLTRLLQQTISQNQRNEL